MRDILPGIYNTRCNFLSKKIPGNDYCMDKVDLSKELTEDIDSRKELTEDIARESLIAISYKVPDTDLPAAMSPKIANGGKVTEPWVCDGDEKYRSELISISYSASPDMKVLPPPLPVDLDA